MLDIAFGRAAVLVVAAAAPVLQHLKDCGSTSTEYYEGPVYEIIGPDTATKEIAATYRIENAALGTGKNAPCPENVTFTFIQEGDAGDGTVVSIPKPPTTTLPDGTCAVSASASHVFARAGRGEVDVEVSAQVVRNGRAARVIKVSDTPATPPTPVTPTPIGGFAAPTQTASPSHPVGIAAGALAPGGALGVATIEDATAPGDSDKLAVYPVNPDGSPGTPVRTDLGAGVNPAAIAASDIDRDGKQDLVVLGTGGGPGGAGSLATFRNTGSGFTPLGSPAYALGNTMDVRDVDGDGAPDVVTNGSSSIWVYLNKNDGSGLDVSPHTSSAGSFTPGPVAILDADGDGKADVAFGDYSGSPGKVAVVLGDGTGTTFGAPQQLVSEAGLTPLAIAAGDVRGTAARDLVFARHTTDQLSVLRNDSTTAGTAAFSDTLLPAAGGDADGKGPDSVTLSDVDKDGRLDIVAANYGSDNDTLYLNPGADGAFAAPVHVPAGKGPQQVVVADMNADGRRDLVTANVGNQDFGDPSKDVAGSISVALANAPAATRGFRVAGARGDLDAAFAAAKKRTAKATTIKAGGGASITIKTLGKTSYAADGTGRLRGAQITGVLTATLSKADRKKIGKAAAAILDARFAGRLDVDRKVDPANGNPLIAKGLLAARATKSRKVQACLRATPGRGGLQHFELIGGTGALAKLRISGDVQPFSLDKVGKKGPKAVISVAPAKKARSLTKACKTLLKQVPKR